MQIKFGLLACACIGAFGMLPAEADASMRAKAIAQTKAAGYQTMTISGCVKEVVIIPLLLSCKYVTMGGKNYSAAVLSEIPGAGSIHIGPIGLPSADRIPAGWNIKNAVAATLGGPSVLCMARPDLNVAGDIVTQWDPKTAIPCSAQ